MSETIDETIARVLAPTGLARAPYSDAERAWRRGAISAAQWGAYCYHWRRAAWRGSTLGLAESRQFARANGFPDPDAPEGASGEGVSS